MNQYSARFSELVERNAAIGIDAAKSDANAVELAARMAVLADDALVLANDAARARDAAPCTKKTPHACEVEGELTRIVVKATNVWAVATRE